MQLALAQLVLILVSIGLAWLIAETFRRLLFSNLTHIPGPKLAALTSWYEFYYDVIQPGQYVWKIKDLHAQYGPIIRVTPWEIHIQDTKFLDEIYAPSFRRRDKYAFQTRTLKLPMSVGGSTKHELHRKRREALNPLFSKQSVMALGSMISEKVGGLCQAFERHARDGTPINLSDLYFAFSQDVVCQYSFGHDSALLQDENRASALRLHLSELLLGVKFNQHFPWIINALDLLPFAVAKYIMPAGVLDMVEFTSAIRTEIEEVLQHETPKKDNQRSIFHELRDNPSLPPSEKIITRLEQEATLLVMAGTESTAKSLAVAHFHLLSNPDIMHRLRKELTRVSNTASWTELEQLPYLSAVIAEANRLSFGVTARVCRIAPDEHLRYKDYNIPAGTPMSMTSLSAHTDETLFPDPWTFKPERWLGQEGVERRKYQMAFNKGGRSCVGINLAHAELFLALAAVARYDIKLWKTGIEDVEFRHDYHVAYPKLGSKGIRALVMGKADLT